MAKKVDNKRASVIRECPAVSNGSRKKGRPAKNKIESVPDKEESCQDHSTVFPKVEDVVTAPAVDQEQIDLLREEFSALSRECSFLRDERDLIFGEVNILRMLLASFNALTPDGKVNFVKPAPNTPYFYLRGMPVGYHFDVIPCTWINGKSDLYRYASGNMFLDEEVANKSCSAINEFLNYLL